MFSPAISFALVSHSYLDEPCTLDTVILPTRSEPGQEPGEGKIQAPDEATASYLHNPHDVNLSGLARACACARVPRRPRDRAGVCACAGVLTHTLRVLGRGRAGGRSGIRERGSGGGEKTNLGGKGGGDKRPSHLVRPVATLCVQSGQKRPDNQERSSGLPNRIREITIGVLVQVCSRAVR